MKSKNNLVPLTKNALKVLEKRYLRKDSNLKVIEKPEDMFWRVANDIALAERDFSSQADVEATAKAFYSLMSNLYFLPNSPTLMNAGRELQQLSACFVLPVEDTMESIFEAVKNTALIHKSGGGTGFSFSRLRPKDDVVQSTKGASSGPVSFMTVFNAATEVIKQGGTRRGANMGILRVDHPDIEDFITAKEDNESLTNFNISVALTDEFMDCVSENRPLAMVNPHSGKTVKTVSARKIFDSIVTGAWKNGEPGIVFIDQINRHNMTPHVGQIESTNPCGEQPLLPFESCNLGSVNLGKMVRDGEIDYELLGSVVTTSVRFLDNVIERNNFPLPEIEDITKRNRKIGLGVMGFADMLIQLGIPYNSDEALTTAENVMAFINSRAYEASEKLAKERGPFPNFFGSVYQRENRSPLRNATRTTIAPTGTISILANASGGIEPLFAVSYIRKNVLDGEEMIEVHPAFEKALKKANIYSEALMRKIAQKGSIQDLDEIPDTMKRIFVTAHDISPRWHIRMQAAFQKFTDNAVSKTVNLPNHATIKDVEEVYWLAYQSGCKGVTVYRDGSRDKQVLNLGNEKTTKTLSQEITLSQSPLQTAPRPREVMGVTREMLTGCGKLYITMNATEDGLFEVFANMGKAGGCASSQTEAIGRLVSLALRSGLPPETVVEQLIGISCHLQVGFGENKVRSCADAIAQAIKHYLDNSATFKATVFDGDEASEDDPLICIEQPRHREAVSRGACPECGGVIEHESGCTVCYCCGYSDCS